MSFLLDTNVLLFWLQDNPRLTPQIIELIQKNTIYVSSISVWEIAIKITTKKLRIAPTYIQQIAHDGFYELPLNYSHIQEVSQLPTVHKDPFDRGLIAQGLAEKLTVITSDTIFKKYPGTYIFLE